MLGGVGVHDCSIHSVAKVFLKPLIPSDEMQCFITILGTEDAGGRNIKTKQTTCGLN
jgi:hypothetical protein